MCGKCGAALQKWGKNKSGSQRYRCKKCGICKTRKREDLTLINRQEKYEEYLVGKWSQSELAAKQKVSRRTINRHFSPFRKLDISLPYADNVLKGEVLVIDGYFHCFGATTLIGITPKGKVINWSFTYGETTTSWGKFFDGLIQVPEAVVGDGQKGMYKALRLRFPSIRFQRCQFHVIMFVNKKLTKNPESMAAISFKQLVGSITRVKSDDGLKDWLFKWKSWYSLYGDFLKEKTFHYDSLTPSGRPKWSYTHARLHAAHSHVKNAYPHLFTYLKDPNIPNTTNHIEGGINSQIRAKIYYHRGSRIEVQRQIIAAFLKSKSG